MKFTINYATKERKWLSNHTYQLVEKTIDVEPTKILRTAIGRVGAAANRFHYRIECVAPSDSEFSYNGIIQANLNRVANKHFNPKNYNWIGNHATP